MTPDAPPPPPQQPGEVTIPLSVSATPEERHDGQPCVALRSFIPGVVMSEVALQPELARQLGKLLADAADAAEGAGSSLVVAPADALRGLDALRSKR